MIAGDNNNTIVVDVIVANCQIRALRPVFDSKNAMPNSGAEKLVWWNTTDSDRLNRRVLGSLGGKALKEAQKLVRTAGLTSAGSTDRCLFPKKIS